MTDASCLKSLLAALLVIVMGCSGSSDSAAAGGGDTNTIAGTGADPFIEILSYGVGNYTGDCMSISTGLSVSGKQSSLRDTGALNGSEFQTVLSRENHVLTLSQKFAADKVTIIEAEWEAAPVTNKATEGLLLRHNTNAVPSDNLALARKENANGDMGLSCNGAVTNGIAKSNMFSVFAKYLKNPKVVFTQCMCGSGSPGASRLSASDFSSLGTSVKIGSYSLDLSKNFVEQTITYNSVSSDKGFNYTLRPTADSLAMYVFNGKIELTSFMAQFADGSVCACQ